MRFSAEEALRATRVLLGGDGPGITGLALVELRPEGGDVLLRFRYRRNPHVLGLRLPLPSGTSPWTGEGVDTAVGWAWECLGLIEEELSTGFVAGADRRARPDHIELVPPPLEQGERRGHDVSVVPEESGGWLLGAAGLEIRRAQRLRLQGRLLVWLQARADTRSAEPVLGHSAVASGDGTTADLAVLEVVPDAPDDVAWSLAVAALHGAADDGAHRITTSLAHPVLLDAGFVAQADGSWVAPSDLLAVRRPVPPGPPDPVRADAALEQVLALARAAEPRCGETVVVAIDGPSGSGKSTLARRIVAELGCPLVPMDDLYPGWDGLSQAVELVTTQVLEPIARGERVTYQRWSWVRNTWVGHVEVPTARILVVEGCGSSVGLAGRHAAVRVWVEADLTTRMRRGIERDGETYRPHWERWARQEEALFAADRTRERADVVVWTGETDPVDGPGEHTDGHTAG